MKYKKGILSTVILLGMATLAAYALQDVDLAGTWNGKMHIPNFGRYEMTLILEKTEEGYKGKVSDKEGYIAEDTEVQELKVDGNQLFCWFELTDGTIANLSLTADGDTMIGEIEREGGVVSCVFVREK